MGQCGLGVDEIRCGRRWHLSCADGASQLSNVRRTVVSGGCHSEDPEGGMDWCDRGTETRPGCKRRGTHEGAQEKGSLWDTRQASLG